MKSWSNRKFYPFPAALAFPAILEERRFFPLEQEREPLALLFDRERERERFLEADGERFPHPLPDFDLFLDLLLKETQFIMPKNPLFMNQLTAMHYWR